MPEYAIVNIDTISNAIVADSKEIAELATGMSVIEAINNKPWIGWTYSDGEWKSPKPTTDQQLVWNSEKQNWEPETQ